MPDVIGAIAGILKPLLDGLASDASFRSGFCWGLMIALAVGFLSREVLYRWNKVLQFFKPTQKPATNPGPSPFSTCMGAIFALLVLMIILVIIVLAIARLVLS
jgi:hypothetical protein